MFYILKKRKKWLWDLPKQQNSLAKPLKGSWLKIELAKENDVASLAKYCFS